MTLRALALEPFFGGSHRAFLEGWRRASRHGWTVEGLEDRHWKWRMRGGAVTLAERVRERVRRGERWDVVVVSDMLDMATFLGLAPEVVRRLPAMVYFHENQLTYPVRKEVERDLHFAFTNLTSALAAAEVWFNSAYHRDEWLAALPDLLRRMPEPQLDGAVAEVRARCRVEPPGIELPTGVATGGAMAERRPGPLQVLWAARWEHDKAPERFFAAVERLEEMGVDFRLSVLGQGFRRVPEVFGWARERFAPHIDRWGFVEGREAYWAALGAVDVVVSTAEHEFFGLAVVEAVAAGAWALVPRRLAYPEVLAGLDGFFYGDGAGGGDGGGAEGGGLERTSTTPVGPGEVTRLGEVAALVAELGKLARRLEVGGRVGLWEGDVERGRRWARRYGWETRAAAMDAGLERLVGADRESSA